MTYRQSCYIISFLLTIKFLQISSTVIIKNVVSNIEYEITVYNGLPWDINVVGINDKNKSIEFLPIIRTDYPFETYDPCNEETFIPKLIKPLLLERFGRINKLLTLDINNNRTNNNNETLPENGWIAMMEADNNIPLQCDGESYLHNLYTPFYALAAQKMGATAAIYLTTRNKGFGVGKSASKTFTFPGVDSKQKTVNGEAITIPLFAVDTFQNIKASNNGGNDDNATTAENKLIDELSSGLLNIAESRYYKQQWVLLQPIHVDWNPFSDLYQHYSVYGLIWAIVGVCSIALSIIIIRNLRDVIMYYKPSNNNDVGGRSVSGPSRVGLKMRFLILLPEFINALFIRPLVAYDPFAFFHHFDFFLGRSLTNLSNSITTFTDVATAIYCYDIYFIFKSSRKFQVQKPAVPFISRYRKGSLLIFSSAFLMVIIDQLVLYLGLIGRLGSYQVLIPVIYQIIVNTITTTIMFKISAMMKQEVTLTYATLLRIQKVSSSLVAMNQPTTTTNNTNNNINNNNINSKSFPAFGSGFKKVATVPTCTASTAVASCTGNEINKKLINKSESLLRMRQYILLAAWSRLFSILGFGLIALNLHLYSAFSFGGTLFGMGLMSLLSSTAQILAALQLPTHRDTTT